MRSDARSWVALLSILAFLQSGCTVVSLRQGFQPPSAVAAAPVESLRVEVAGDRRPLGGRSSLGPGYLALLPLFPYGHQKIAPEFAAMGASIESDSLAGDLAAIVAADLRAAGLARRVNKGSEALSDLGVGPERASQDHVLRITLDEGLYHRYLTLYGLSFAGALLWMVGLPNSYGRAELAFSAELVAPDGRVLGTRSFEGSARATEFLYRAMPFAYSGAMPRAYAEISPELRVFVADSIRR